MDGDVTERRKFIFTKEVFFLFFFSFFSFQEVRERTREALQRAFVEPQRSTH
jgi:hypothetical protein